MQTTVVSNIPGGPAFCEKRKKNMQKPDEPETMTQTNDYGVSGLSDKEAGCDQTKMRLLILRHDISMTFDIVRFMRGVKYGWIYYR